MILCIFFFLNNFIYLFLAVLVLHCCAGFSLVAASGVSRGYSSLQCVGFSLLWLPLRSNKRSGLLWCVGFSNCSTWSQELQLLGSRVP